LPLYSDVACLRTSSIGGSCAHRSPLGQGDILMKLHGNKRPAGEVHVTSSVRLACAAVLLCGTVFVDSAFAQQRVPFQSGYPVAPTGLADQRLPAGPFLYLTAEQQDVRVRVITHALQYPYSIAFLPSGEMLVTERAGRLRILRNGVLDPRAVSGGPAARFAGRSGMVGAVHGYMSPAAREWSVRSTAT
jgi:glucose/arabinose dehydrogenase